MRLEHQKECQSALLVSSPLGRTSQCVFLRQRDHHHRPYLQPDPLKAAADQYQRTPLRVCNLLKHVDGVMSRVAVTPQGATDQYQAKQGPG